jgi:hypothetical protein
MRYHIRPLGAALTKLVDPAQAGEVGLDELLQDGNSSIDGSTAPGHEQSLNIARTIPEQWSPRTQ